MRNKSAYEILHDIIKKKEERPFMGAMPVNTPQKVNRDGAINEAIKMGGFKLPRHPLYKDYKGIVAVSYTHLTLPTKA